MSVSVLDYSEVGLGVGASDELLVCAGDILEHVDVRVDGRPVYMGRARVIHDLRRPDRLGLALLDEPLSVQTIEVQERRAGETAQAMQQMGVLGDLLDPRIVPAGYRAAVADLRLCLESVGETLTALASQPGFDSTTILTRIEESVFPHFMRLLTRLRESVQDSSPEEEEVAAAYARWFLHPIVLQAPVPRRAYEKPLGYAGDFLLMDLMYREADDAVTLLGRLINRLCFRLPGNLAAQARIPFLADLLRREIEGRESRPVRIASFAAGPAAEISLLLPSLSQSNHSVEVTLIDQDPEALTFAQRRFLTLRKEGNLPSSIRLRYFHSAVKTAILEPDELLKILGTFDVIYTVGLFDYLPDPVARALGRSFSRFLSPGGVLLIGNHTYHDAQTFLEHVLDWRLLYRDAEALRRLGTQIGELSKRTFRQEILSEPNGLYLLLSMRNEPS